MKFVTANIGRNYRSIVELSRNLRTLRAAVGAAFIGFQEVDEADDANEHALLRARFHRHSWAGFDTRVPIAVPPNWRIVSEKVTRASAGVKRQTPPRVVVEAIVENTEREDLPRIAVLNWHSPRNVEVLEDEREETLEAVEDRIALLLEAGLPVVAFCDANDRRLRRLGRNERRVVHAGIDYVLIYPGDRDPRIEVGRIFHVDLTIDGHNAHGFEGTLTKAGRR